MGFQDGRSTVCPMAAAGTAIERNGGTLALQAGVSLEASPAAIHPNPLGFFYPSDQFKSTSLVSS